MSDHGISLPKVLHGPQLIWHGIKAKDPTVPSSPFMIFPVTSLIQLLLFHPTCLFPVLQTQPVLLHLRTFAHALSVFCQVACFLQLSAQMSLFN